DREGCGPFTISLAGAAPALPPGDGGLGMPLTHRTSDAACQTEHAPASCESGCNDECTHDRDCAAGQTCMCRLSQGNANLCVPSNCRVDGDCGAGAYCSP